MRIIPRLDVKGGYLIKGIGFEGLRKLGDPAEFAFSYAAQGAHELFFLDVVATLFGRNHLIDVIKAVSQDLFIPLTVGGGIASIHHAEEVFKSGADKISINSAAVYRPEFIDELVSAFGSQSIVLSVEAKKEGDDWIAYTEFGREKSDRLVSDWINEGVARGVGEVCLTSIDHDGRRKGIDHELLSSMPWVDIPLIYSGGLRSLDEVRELRQNSNVSAVAVGSALHYRDLTLESLIKTEEDSSD